MDSLEVTGILVLFIAPIVRLYSYIASTAQSIQIFIDAKPFLLWD